MNTTPDNLALWHAVEKTDPAHVKPITGKAYSGTSPKPHYLIHKATEMFGPCGIGWGFTVVDERVEDGAVVGERVHLARVRVWYKWNGERGEVEHLGGTPFCGVRRNGNTFIDEDAPKKSVTDALVKALSMIGFAGDIFMGRYDDSKYVHALREEAAEAHQDPRQSAPRPKAVEPAPPPPSSGPIVSSAMRKRLQNDMGRRESRASLKLWSELVPVREAIEGLTDNDQAMFEIEYRKKWESLPEDQAITAAG